MRNIRKGLLLLLCAVLLLQLPLAVRADETEVVSEYTWITDREAVDGSDYTEDPVLAETLNSIFDGNANVYYDWDCTQMVNTKLGTYRVPNNGVFKYVGTQGDVEQLNMGTSCWIYANGVYFTLFGEATGNGTPGENSELLDLTATETSSITYENFTAWGVRPGVGALVRTRGGHSMIILGYDEERMIILDGNGDGKGLVSIRVRTWDRIYDRAKYIIQPKQEHMDALYPDDHTAAARTLSEQNNEHQDF